LQWQDSRGAWNDVDKPLLSLFLADDWEVVPEEPASSAYLEDSIKALAAQLKDSEATVARLKQELSEAREKLGEDPMVGTWGSNDGQAWAKVTNGRTAHFRYLSNVWRSDG
jgi:hypothetical protein